MFIGGGTMTPDADDLTYMADNGWIAGVSCGSCVNTTTAELYINDYWQPVFDAGVPVWIIAEI